MVVVFLGIFLAPSPLLGVETTNKRPTPLGFCGFGEFCFYSLDFFDQFPVFQIVVTLYTFWFKFCYWIIFPSISMCLRDLWSL